MQNKGLPSLTEAAILLYCVWMALDLPQSWVSTPSVRYAWIAFFLWLTPWMWVVGRKIFFDEEKGSTLLLLGLAVVSALAGFIGSLHILNHFGLALALAGMLPWSWQQMIWLLSSISWTPALGYMTKHFELTQQLALQISLAASGSVWLLMKRTNV